MSDSISSIREFGGLEGLVLINDHKPNYFKLESGVRKIERPDSDKPLSIIDLSGNFVLIPEVLFDNDLKHQLIGVSNSDSVKAVKYLNDVVVWNQSTQTDYSNVKSLVHFAHCILMYNESQENGLNAFWSNDKLFVCLKIKDQLHLINSYEAKTVEEALYYLMLITQEFDLDQETFCFELMADNESSDTFIDESKKYFRNLTTYEGTEAYKQILSRCIS